MYLNRTTEHSDIVTLAATMRPEDKEEIWKWRKSGPYDELVESVRVSKESYSALYKGETFAIWGLRETNIINGSARIWLLCSADIEKHKKYFWKTCSKVMKKWKREYYTLYNWMHQCNEQPQIWLTKMGFTFKPPDKKGFQYFYWSQLCAE